MGGILLSQKRKDEHLKIAYQLKVGDNCFDDVEVIHQNLSGLSLDSIDLSADFLGFKVDYPFYINAITGGSKKAYEINDFLSKIAHRFNIPMLVGSQTIMITNPALTNSFNIVRQNNPKGIVVANVNLNTSIEDINLAIDAIKANALSVHLNIVQEVVMAEGDRDFSNWPKRLENIIKKIPINVIIKEVGFGMSNDEVKTLYKMGVKYVDISGKGGTNFADIESIRTHHANLYSSIGKSTVNCLIDLKELDKKPIIYASGGIRHELDVLKALLLGAKMVGMAKFFLDLTKLPLADAYDRVEQFILNLRKLFLIAGIKNINEIKGR